MFENKQLVFLEKDYKCPNSDDSIERGKSFLETWLNLPQKQVDEMIVRYQFNQMDRDKLYKIIFNPDNVIVTHSVYVQGSDTLFNKLIASTGSNDIKGLNYIDASGALIEHLNRKLRNVEKNLFELIAGINTTNIVSINQNERDFKNIKPILLKVDIKGVYEDCVVFKDLVEENLIPFNK
jgi:hypothetical protein